MARDPGLEEVVREMLGDRDGLSEKAMFGGLCWMLDGHMLCAARDDGALVRLGKGQDGWALAMDGIAPMVMQGRPMTGWVWVEPDAFADEALAARLIGAALDFVRALPAKA